MRRYIQFDEKILRSKVLIGCNVRLFDLDIDSPLFKIFS